MLSLWLVLGGQSRDLGIEVDWGSSRFDLRSNLHALAMDFHTISPCEVGLDSRFEVVLVLTLRVWVLSSTGLRSVGLANSIELT